MLFKRRTDVTTTPAATNGGSIASRGGAVLDRATSIYRNNPKTVGGIALVASALLLNRLRARPR